MNARERGLFRAIVRGVHGALADAGNVPVSALDAALYESVMQIVRERDEARAEQARNEAVREEALSALTGMLEDDLHQAEARIAALKEAADWVLHVAHGCGRGGEGVDAGEEAVDEQTRSIKAVLMDEMHDHALDCDAKRRAESERDKWEADALQKLNDYKCAMIDKAAVEAERDTLREEVKRRECADEVVRLLHVEVETLAVRRKGPAFWQRKCRECAAEWPCPTRRALEGEK